MAHKLSLNNPQKLFSILSRPQKKLIVIFFEEGAKLKILRLSYLYLSTYLNIIIMNNVFIYLEIYCCLKKLIDLESVVSFLMPRFMKLFWFLVVQILISYVFFCLFFLFHHKKILSKSMKYKSNF